ncbi:MAG: hypothetical protein HY079_07610 [Elusimicrobia bacterium]|nr:hypothetical protein [Elusimicrobiota bacterium]
MWPISPRRLLTLAAAALALRACCAVLTEFKPIFPPYYYTDAGIFHKTALAALDRTKASEAPSINGTLSERLQILMTLMTYRIFGAFPLAIKLVNAVLGAAAVAALAWALAFVFGERPAFWAGALAAAWPSDVFYTSQNLKESPTQLMAFAGLGAFLALGRDERLDRPRTAALAAAAAAGLIGAGTYRSYVLLSLSLGLGVVFGLETFRRPRLRLAVPGLTLATVLCAFPSATGALLRSFAASGGRDSARAGSLLIPETLDNADPSHIYRPTSPEGLTGFRRNRQDSDRTWAKVHAERDIATQIFPDAVFATWLDVLAYLPKGVFYVLFMPLPGLYPMDGKVGRVAAALENTLLLGLALAALVGFVRGPKTPARLGLLAFFAVMATGAALLEFDLGSAGRHKLLYLPMLFPFAAEEALRLLGRKEPA